MIRTLFDLSRVGGWKNTFLLTSLVAYSVTQADLDFLRPIFWVSLGMFFFLSLIDISRFFLSNRVPTYKFYMLWVIMIIGLCAVSRFWAYNPDAVDNSQYIPNAVYTLFVLAGLSSSMKTKKDIFSYIDIYILAANLISFILFIGQVCLEGSFARLGDAFGIVPNGPAMQMGFALMSCLMMLGIREHGKKFYLVSIVWLLIAIVATDSRKIILAVALVLFIYFIYNRRGYFDFRKLLIAIPVAFLCVAAVLFVPVLKETIGYRLVGVFTGMFSDGSVDLSSQERDFYRDTALMLFSQSPVVGIGFEGFSSYLQSIGYWHVAYSHCNYTELLCNIGIVGLCVYYVMYVYMIIGCIKNIDGNRFLAGSITVILMIRLAVEYGQVVYIDMDNYVFLMLLFGAYKTLVQERKSRGEVRENGDLVCSVTAGGVHGQ